MENELKFIMSKNQHPITQNPKTPKPQNPKTPSIDILYVLLWLITERFTSLITCWFINFNFVALDVFLDEK